MPLFRIRNTSVGHFAENTSLHVFSWYNKWRIFIWFPNKFYTNMISDNLCRTKAITTENTFNVQNSPFFYSVPDHQALALHKWCQYKKLCLHTGINVWPAGINYMQENLLQCSYFCFRNISGLTRCSAYRGIMCDMRK